jgi:phage-related protein
MGFMDFLKGIGSFVKSGIQKVAGVVGKFAPLVSGIAGAIPLPFTQGIAQAANLVGGVANAANGVVSTDPNQVQQGVQQVQQAGQQISQLPAGVQQQVPAGTAPPQGPIM